MASSSTRPITSATIRGPAWRALHGKASTSKEQAEYCVRMIRRPADDIERTNRVWTKEVHALRDAYEMSP